MTTKGLTRTLPGLALLGAVLVVSSAAQAGTTTPPRPPVEVKPAPPSSAIPGQYIVRLKEGAGSFGVVIPPDVKPLHTYQKVVTGFAARLTPAQLNDLRYHPAVVAIEQDALAYAFDLPSRPTGPAREAPPTAPTASWGLDRIDQRRLPLNRMYNSTRTGAGVTAYIIDSGIDRAHTQFTGRIAPGFSAVNDGYGTNDCLGHGTTVAGIVGGTTWGVARGVKLAPVRVLGCNGSGAYSQIIAGFDWVAANAVKPAVANASLGGPRSDAANFAATALADAGVFVSTAAGNSTVDACTISPASAPRVLTVGASTINDTIAPFSNRGPCVDLIAPGAAVISARRGGGSTVGSGTSFASPYAAGVGALFKQAYGDGDTAALLKRIVTATTPDAVRGLTSSTRNRLLYTAGL
ncbi:S8 family peptidase [Sphaerisporangium sp. TRM90804]|uniref:S8 family peptidase n=1 Tax=Sphaerisporangium sp. TRM90804 TaxID=3031113 RepID=UPI002447D65D|nr:S8 family peptidase [Sphaerisporangium sp. TRM90804]MDH2430037.1 S8 family peptidase [Sphaerisporangium sp. TRM90804]